MRYCKYCTTVLPENSRFCSHCGRMQDDEAASSTYLSSQNTGPIVDAPTLLQTAPSSSQFPISDADQAVANPIDTDPTLITQPLPDTDIHSTLPTEKNDKDNDDDKDDDDIVILPFVPPVQAAPEASVPVVHGTLPASIPMVQGTAPIGSVPSIAEAPTSYTNAPASHPVSEPVMKPVSHPVSAPVMKPVSHPVSEPVNTPYPQPTHYPPERPGTQEHHPPHKHHEYRTNFTQDAAESVTKVAGGSAVKTIIIVVAVVVVAAGGIAAATHIFSPPQPLISVTSNYTVDNTPAGASGTVLHISGQKFSSNSAITFLLDGNAAPGNPSAQSDSNGNFSTDVTVTDAWSVGIHTLTATDASNNSTKTGVSVTVVQPGQANTPGPNGAPPDDASFQVIAQIQGSQSTATEIVTGHPDPMGGTVCQPEDNGQPIVTTGFTTNVVVPVQETRTLSCTGSYKGGQLTLTETFTSDVRVYSQADGTTATCTLNSPQPDEELSGNYTGNNTFSGTITYPTIPDSDYSCNGDGFNTFYNFYQGGQDNWTGQVTGLQN